MQEPAAGSSRFVFQRSLARKRFALLYGTGVMLALIIILTVVRPPLDVQPAAVFGFPVALLAGVAMIFVLLVLVSPSVPSTWEEDMALRLNVICDPAIAIDPESGRIIAMNDLAAELFGIREQIVGQDVSVIAGPAPNQDVTADVLAFRGAEYTRLGYYTLRLAEGGSRQLPVTARMGNVHNHDTTVLVFRADEVDRALANFARVQERLMSNISHELRSPLNVVMGFSELMESGTLGELSGKQADAAREVHDGGERMLHLIDDVLDVGRARNYNLELTAGDIKPSKLIARIRDLVAGTARREKVTLDFQDAKDLPALSADERTVKQLLYHLTLGAIDRATPGGVVRVRMEPAADGITFRIMNTAQGLSARDLAALESPSPELSLGAEGLPMVLGMELCVTLAQRLGISLTSGAEGEETVVGFTLSSGA